MSQVVYLTYQVLFEARNCNLFFYLRVGAEATSDSAQGYSYISAQDSLVAVLRDHI